MRPMTIILIGLWIGSGCARREDETSPVFRTATASDLIGVWEGCDSSQPGYLKMVFMANGAGEGCEVHCEMNNALAFRFRWEIDGERVRCVKDEQGIYRVFAGDIPAPAPPEYSDAATAPLLLRAQQYNMALLGLWGDLSLIKNGVEG